MTRESLPKRSRFVTKKKFPKRRIRPRRFIQYRAAGPPGLTNYWLKRAAEMLDEVSGAYSSLWDRATGKRRFFRFANGRRKFSFDEAILTPPDFIGAIRNIQLAKALFGKTSRKCPLPRAYRCGKRGLGPRRMKGGRRCRNYIPMKIWERRKNRRQRFDRAAGAGHQGWEYFEKSRGIPRQTFAGDFVRREKDRRTESARAFLQNASFAGVGDRSIGLKHLSKRDQRLVHPGRRRDVSHALSDPEGRENLNKQVAYATEHVAALFVKYFSAGFLEGGVFSGRRLFRWKCGRAISGRGEEEAAEGLAPQVTQLKPGGKDEGDL